MKEVWMLNIFFVWSFWTGVLTDAPTKFLFTVPLNLWQNSEEEFCISFHHDEPVNADYNVTLSSEDRNFRQVLGRGTATVEGRVCHKFTVPDTTGRLKLTLVTDTKRTVNNVISSVYREDNTEVEVHESSVKTFVQTDKPMYKPGETVKFRTMTINKDLKPWTGVVPLVTVKNPADVRVMQWKNVENMKGLVSFEMSLSDDPPLGVWKITILVEGKEHEQTFTVQEYVLPKFEVSITAPKYLLPTSKTINGTVCAKYTYGKPVEGTVELTVCYTGARYDGHRDRPCARRIVDINGCQTYTVDGSELYLDSSNYSRYGNLEINATVTEAATGVKLNGTMKGPEMTFEALKLKFEDDTRNYFKDAFPYYARVIVTKPDGSPAPGEILEVAVDNFNPGFHLKRNFTSDENGLVKFVIKKLPTDVNKLSIKARAPKYYEPYSSSYYYVVRMYEPNAYHQAIKWYSPSNSYIHIPSVEGQIDCGSTLDIDVLYSTARDTDYKFFVQVLSNSHMVHHSHVQHHFLIHDAVNFDDIPNEMLLDLYAPAATRRRYYPHNYDKSGDPELAQKPAAVNVTVTVDSNGRKQVEQCTHIAKVKLSIPVTANMGPEAQLLVYYVRDDDETVAATLTFKVNKCFDNKVEMKFDESTVYPGNDVQFNLKASPGSLCSVGVVDKSINLIGGDHQITPEKIFGQFKMIDKHTSYWNEEKKYCEKKTLYDPYMSSYVDSYWQRKYVTDAVDSISAFRDIGLVVFTDLTLETRPCKLHVAQIPIRHNPFLVSKFYRPFVFRRFGGSIHDYPGMEHSIHDYRGMEHSVPNYLSIGGNYANGPLDTMDSEITTTFQPVRTTLIDKKSSQKPIGLRKDFAEAWLWHLYLVGDEGEITVTSKLPHTITEWVGNSVCTNLDVGVGVSPMIGITAFQPFFLSFTLPYSAVRGEIVPVLVSIFNYMTECLVMQVSLPPSSDFGIDGDTTKSSHTSCVCPGETRTIKYHVIPYTLGKIKILATAESLPDDGTCGNNAVSMDGVGSNDAVQMKLLIEAEGIEKEYTITSYICPEGKTSKEEMVLPLPSDTELVDDSARGYISVIGDIMGPALSNLKDLLQMPYGCGEQNMASFSPNIFALQYLTNTNQLLPKIEEEALGYMRIGYQRQLKYRHGDGSYSAWGGEGSGSIWLTSFVIKCLGQSRPFIDIDDNDLKQSISWFKSRQLENGCFPQIGYTHSYHLKGGFSDRSNDASLTAFVLIAMLEAGINSSDLSVIKAVGCLDVQDIPDTYTMSLMAYAYTLYDLTHARRQVVMKILEERAVNKDGLKFWTRTEKNETKEKNSWYYTAVSAEVEMTAYVLLSYITGEQHNAAINARPIVMWLTKQRNPRGGFSSTQDTIVALQALARYATLVYQGGVNVSVIVIDKTKGSIGTFNIGDDNTLVLQSKRITNLPTTLNAVVDGVGCAMVQANVKYNVYETPKSPTFDMSVNVYRAKDQVNHCGMRTLSICVRFTGPGGVSNMAIVDVKMVTGWIPVKDSLEKLLVNKNSPNFIGIEKYEVDGSYVHIYFDQLDSTSRCFLVDVEQNIEISAPKPAQVKVYDYYEVDFTLIVNYEIKTTCGTKEELPYVSAQEYYSGLMVDIPIDEIVQVRIPPRFEFGGLPPVQSPKSCPVCMTTVDIKSDSFKAMVCGSQKIYKVEKGRKGDYPLKVFVNLRQQKKETINVFAKLKYDQRCTCDLIGGKLGKILVFSERDTFNDKEQILEFNVSTKVIKRSGALEKEIYRHVKKANCK